jgi:hypothetical protein
MQLKDCTEGNQYRQAQMDEALRCRNGELNIDTIMDYIGFCCGICGAGNTLVLPYKGKIFHIRMSFEIEDQSNVPLSQKKNLADRVKEWCHQSV